MSHRKLNFLFIFISIVLFVLEASIVDRYHLLFALVAALTVSFIAFLLNLLTLDGARASVMLGLVAFGFGGIEPAVLLVAFFVTSNAIGLFFSKDPNKPLSSVIDRRNGTQVWSNGFWFSLYLCIWYILKADMFFVAAVGAIATACADTWATEFGTRIGGKTVLITDRKVVDPGTDGGISFAGTSMAFSGALLIGLLTLLFDKNFATLTVISIVIGGFLGSMIDSWLGAVFQTGNKRLPNLLDSFGNQDNNSVNFIATGIGSFLTIITYNLLIYVVV